MTATGTKKQKQETKQGGEGRGQSALASSGPTQSNGKSQRRQTPGARTRGQQSSNGTQRSGLMNINPEQLARGLGWFSIGLGLAEVLAPRGIAKIAGSRGKNTGMIRLFGLREIASGIAIFAQGRRPAAALWSRVAGDALDLAALAVTFASPDSSKGRTMFATTNVLAVTALDVLCAQQLSSNNNTTEGGTAQVKKSTIINRSPEELYAFWRELRNLPRIVNQLESVTETDARRSHWVAKAPAGSKVEWDAEITEEREGEFIAWRSIEGSEVDNYGSVRFEPATGNRGTIVSVEMEYTPPGGVIGTTVAKLFGDEPGQQAQEALRCFKQVMELGEVVISEGTVWDNGLLTQRPAQPPASEELGTSRGAGAS
jgi:uncharacterized membrane protein